MFFPVKISVNHLFIGLFPFIAIEYIKQLVLGGIGLKNYSSAIDKFCYKHPRFGIPKLMLYIIIGNAIVYLFGLMDTTGTFLSYLYFNPALVLQGQVWRLITFIFIPSGSNIFFVAIFLYFYYFIGSTLENHWGAPRFTIYYISGILLTVIYGFIAWLITGDTSSSLDSTYINLSMFFAFAVLFPDMRVLLFFIIPIKIKWLAILDAVYFLVSIFITPFPANLLPIVAILNFFIFCGGTLMDYIRPHFRRNTKQTINFRKEARKVKQEQSSLPYRHKCEVCGRTDAEYPNLEFRYCSKCNGYHCFCIDHINNHIHFQ